MVNKKWALTGVLGLLPQCSSQVPELERSTAPCTVLCTSTSVPPSVKWGKVQ